MNKANEGKSGFNLVTRLEQINEAWMKDILQKFTKPGTRSWMLFLGLFLLRRLARFFQSLEDLSDEW